MTELVIFCLPYVAVVIALGTVAAMIIWLFRTNVARSWLRVCMRGAGTLLVLPLILVVLLLIFMGACTTRPRIIVSPDSQHVAEYYYESGFLGRDSTFVSVKGKWSLRGDTVYQFSGPSDWTSTQVFWLDNHRLMIRYDRNEVSTQEEWKTEGAGIDVLCESTPH
jgi:energy-coupling factor transporter transmembrane protein EcfT